MAAEACQPSGATDAADLDATGAKALESLGLDTLKQELQLLGLKCGGTLEEFCLILGQNAFDSSFHRGARVH